MATALETEYCQEYNMKQGIKCTNKFKLIRCDGKRVCNQHKKIPRKCRENDCEKQPYFGTEKNKGLYCAAHKKEGMRDVVNKTCLEDDCEKQPYFGTEKNKGLYCAAHKKEGMRDVVNKTCLEDDCEKQPYFGTEKNKGLYCDAHKKEGMRDVKHNLCLEDGCQIRPCFGTEKNKGLYCDSHKKEWMRDVVNKTCLEDGCEIRPYYGTHLTNIIHCSNHRNKETEWKLTNCNTSKCRRISTHSETGSRPFLYCDNHSPSDYSSELSSTCVSCNLTELICDEDGKCLLACSRVHLTRMKYTENKMMDFLTSKKLQFINDRTASDGCSKKRPDFVFQTNYGVIIVENDENQHKSYACECEQMRMMTIHQDCGESVHFIRFNPDRYSLQESKTNECIDLDKRHKLLFGILKPILKYPESFFTNHIGLTVRYMFYDNCNDQFEIQTINY
jgi:hypothetical protein